MAGSMCYFFLNTTLLSADIFESCNAFGSLCCNVGDLCLPDAFCYTTDQTSYTSGYYIGACSDSSFPDPDCATHCDRWPSSDVVYNSTTQLWACCFNPTENIVDCTNPGNETFQAPAPSVSASATLTLNPASTLATLLSPTTKIPTGSPISSSKPDDSSSSTQPQSCKDSSQRATDIGLGASVGVLGAAVVSGVVAYASQNRGQSMRENREGRNPRRGNNAQRDGGPGGGDGPGGGNSLVIGKNSRGDNLRRRGHDHGGSNDPGGGNGPNRSYRSMHQRDQDRWGGNDDNYSKRGNNPGSGKAAKPAFSHTSGDFPPKDQPATRRNKNNETRSYKTVTRFKNKSFHNPKSSDPERGRKRDSSRSWAKKSTRRVLVSETPKRPHKRRSRNFVGFTESLGGSKFVSNEERRKRWSSEVTKSSYKGPGVRSSSSSSKSPTGKGGRPVVPTDPNNGPGEERSSSSSSSPSTRWDWRRPGPRIVSRSPRPREQEIQVVQVESQNLSTMSRRFSPSPPGKGKQAVKERNLSPGWNEENGVDFTSREPIPKVRTKYDYSEWSDYDVEEKVVKHHNMRSREGVGQEFVDHDDMRRRESVAPEVVTHDLMRYREGDRQHPSVREDTIQRRSQTRHNQVYFS